MLRNGAAKDRDFILRYGFLGACSCACTISRMYVCMDTYVAPISVFISAQSSVEVCFERSMRFHFQNVWKCSWQSFFYCENWLFDIFRGACGGVLYCSYFGWALCALGLATALQTISAYSLSISVLCPRVSFCCTVWEGLWVFELNLPDKSTVWERLWVFDWTTVHRDKSKHTTACTVTSLTQGLSWREFVCNNYNLGRRA